MGLGLVIVGSRGGETAGKGTVRNVIVRDLYWLLWEAGVWESITRDLAKLYFEGMVLVIGSSRGG